MAAGPSTPTPCTWKPDDEYAGCAAHNRLLCRWDRGVLTASNYRPAASRPRPSWGSFSGASKASAGDD